MFFMCVCVCLIVCGFTTFIYLLFYNSKQFICSAHDKKMFLLNNGDEGGAVSLAQTLSCFNCSSLSLSSHFTPFTHWSMSCLLKPFSFLSFLSLSIETKITLFIATENPIQSKLHPNRT